ncbi:MAG TPA: dethiobiotin synthase, partial [Rhodocyclaceae bacterium]|nr:dethiobiotin synthase [Rhodocyclaceae bacterium]
MKSSGYFLTGTDTDIGKTFVACALLHAWRRKGLRVVGYKPVAAGAEKVNGELVNDDARRLQAASSDGFTLAQINPVCLPEAVAPHIAAAHAGREIEFDLILSGYRYLATDSDRVLVEGVGGFRVPLGDAHDTADMALALNLPVILVVGI